MNRAELRIKFESKETARIVAKAIELENDNYISMKVEGNEILAVAEAKNLLSLLHTLDDFLACAALAYRSDGLKEK
ncbi:MAG: KEOPS complex subunit Pcc1 [Thermoplasmata archaeon]